MNQRVDQIGVVTEARKRRQDQSDRPARGLMEASEDDREPFRALRKRVVPPRELSFAISDKTVMTQHARIRRRHGKPQARAIDLRRVELRRASKESVGEALSQTLHPWTKRTLDHRPILRRVMGLRYPDATDSRSTLRRALARCDHTSGDDRSENNGDNGPEAKSMALHPDDATPRYCWRGRLRGRQGCGARRG